MKWIRKLLARWRLATPDRGRPVAPPLMSQSGMSELEVERRLRRAESVRTDRLAQIIADYRRQDAIRRTYR